MAPECAESERIEVFRCTKFPDRWESHAVLLEGVKAFDPTIFEHDGVWWMFATLQHDGNSTDDELHLFHASTPLGPWSPHPLNPVCLDVRAARPAGAVFEHNGRLYRPAQDCSRRYGWAMTIQEITVLTKTDFEQVEIRRVEPGWAADGHATHTVNQSCGVTLYDCEVSRLKF